MFNKIYKQPDIHIFQLSFPSYAMIPASDWKDRPTSATQSSKVRLGSWGSGRSTPTVADSYANEVVC
jgi:hypothetical protein